MPREIKQNRKVRESSLSLQDFYPPKNRSNEVRLSRKDFNYLLKEQNEDRTLRLKKSFLFSLQPIGTSKSMIGTTPPASPSGLVRSPAHSVRSEREMTDLLNNRNQREIPRVRKREDFVLKKSQSLLFRVTRMKC